MSLPIVVDLLWCMFIELSEQFQEDAASQNSIMDLTVAKIGKLVGKQNVKVTIRNLSMILKSVEMIRGFIKTHPQVLWPVSISECLLRVNDMLKVFLHKWASITRMPVGFYAR